MNDRDAFLAVARAHRPEDPVSVPAGVLIALLAGSSVVEQASPLPPMDLTCAEVGQRLGRAASTIRSYCERGELPGAYRWRAREWRIPPAALLSLEEAERDRGTGRAGSKPTRSRRHAVDLGAWRSAS